MPKKALTLQTGNLASFFAKQTEQSKHDKINQKAGALEDQAAGCMKQAAAARSEAATLCSSIPGEVSHGGSSSRCGDEHQQRKDAVTIIDDDQEEEVNSEEARDGN